MKMLRAFYLVGALTLMASCIPLGDIGPLLPSMDMNIGILGVTDEPPGDLAVAALSDLEEAAADSARRSCEFPYRLGETAGCFVDVPTVQDQQSADSVFAN